MTAGTLTIDAKKFRVVPDDEYQAMRTAFRQQSAEDRADVREATRRLGDPNEKHIPWSSVGKPQGLGPQYRKDSPFAARMRLHQSWYRAKVLCLPCGTGPTPKATSHYGNMLTSGDAKAGRNFLTPKSLGRPALVLMKVAAWWNRSAYSTTCCRVNQCVSIYSVRS